MIYNKMKIKLLLFIIMSSLISQQAKMDDVTVGLSYKIE